MPNNNVNPDRARAAGSDSENRAHKPPAPGPGICQHLVAQLVFTGVLLGLFIAADHWQLRSGLGVASVIAVVAGALAGFTITTASHEWFHYLGARLAGGNYTVARRFGIQVFDWDYRTNSLARFYGMSLAGTLGSITAIAVLMVLVAADTLGRCALLAAACGSLVFAGTVEWPVLLRVLAGASPQAALGRINQGVVLSGFALGLLITALLIWWLYSG